MGFRGRRNEQAYEYYLERRRQAAAINLGNGNEDMKKLAALIYRELLQLERNGEQ